MKDIRPGEILRIHRGDGIALRIRASHCIELWEHNDNRPKAGVQLVATARDLYQNDEFEVDDDARVSESEAGWWVQGWLWVHRQELNGKDWQPDGDCAESPRCARNR